jgi:hypothetical protein
MKRPSFLRRLFPGQPAPVAKPLRTISLADYTDLLLAHNQTLTALNEVNQMNLNLMEEHSRVRAENTALRLILSGNYRTSRKSDAIC